MLTEVMRYYGLARPPIDAGFYETDHHAQVLRDVRAAILGGRLVALTAVIGSGKTILSRRLRAELEREGRVIVSRSLTVEKAKITVPLDGALGPFRNGPSRGPHTDSTNCLPVTTLHRRPEAAEQCQRQGLRT
jgi:ABC-type dipeptide/oligopeptide/nickel transport system ATPase component